MSQNKKYDFQVTQGNTSWTTKIIRQVTSKRTVVSKRQDGFATESEAQEWGQNEIKSFLQNLTERNKHRSQLHAQKKKHKLHTNGVTNGVRSDINTFLYETPAMTRPLRLESADTF